MSRQQLISTLQPLPVQDKLAIIEFLSLSVQQELSETSSISAEAKQFLSVIQNDPSWTFLKSADEDGYSESNIKERR